MTFAPTGYVAVDEVLRADTGAGKFMEIAVDRGVYAAGDVPENQRLTDGGSKVGYAEIGSSNETEEGTFGLDGDQGSLTITFRATSKRTALLLYKRARAVLHNRILGAAGQAVLVGDSQQIIAGTVRLIEDFANPDGGHSAVAQYLTVTVSTA